MRKGLWSIFAETPATETLTGSFAVSFTVNPPPLKWSDLRYVFDIQEDCNGKEAIQARIYLGEFAEVAEASPQSTLFCWCCFATLMECPGAKLPKPPARPKKQGAPDYVTVGRWNAGQVVQ